MPPPIDPRPMHRWHVNSRSTWLNSSDATLLVLPPPTFGLFGSQPISTSSRQLILAQSSVSPLPCIQKSITTQPRDFIVELDQQQYLAFLRHLRLASRFQPPVCTLLVSTP